MDAIGLDGLLDELRPRLLGRRLVKPAAAGAHGLCWQLASDRDLRLWLDADRDTAGLYLLRRDAVRRLAALSPAVAPATRHAGLHFRKHADGLRVTRLERLRGERILIVGSAEVELVLRLSGAAPALTLVVSGRAVSTVGAAGPAWPLPEARPDFLELEPDDRRRALAAAATDARPLRRLLSEYPGLGPWLAARWLADDSVVRRLELGLRDPSPTLLLPDLPDPQDVDDRDAAAATLAPLALPARGQRAEPGISWVESSARLLELRMRGRRFAELQRSAIDAGRRDERRLARLESHLVGDLAGLDAPEELRRQGQALLAALGRLPAGPVVEIADPSDPARRLHVTLDQRLTPAANADRLFDKARRSERAARDLARRLAQTRAALGAARERVARAVAARRLDALEAPGPEPRAAPAQRRGPRRYLTTAGLTLLVGRGARENQQLTFGVARPEDFWLHVRDAPGAHVILRDPDGRATGEDLREAAELAAFFAAASAGPVDVHVARRKHLRSAGAGRVRVGHSETLRATPRDPEGRLRRR